MPSRKQGKGLSSEFAAVRTLVTVTKSPTKQRRLQHREKRGLRVNTEEVVDVTHSRDICDGLGHVFGFLP